MPLATVPRPCERVLVVDDSPDLVESLRDVLELGGATVATATCISDAERVLGSGFQPSVILVDVRLGRGTRGDEFARQLRSTPESAGTPIVLMSGDLHELRRLDNSGDADATLGKPFEIEHLFDVLSEMCSEQRV